MRVVVVPDDLDVIACELKQLNCNFDLVISSGGVGPTHDDVTLRAVAAALEVPFEVSEEMMKTIERRMPDATLDPSTLHKMSMLPGGAKLRWAGESQWPILQCANIFALPGVPTIFEASKCLLHARARASWQLDII